MTEYPDLNAVSWFPSRRIGDASKSPKSESDVKRSPHPKWPARRVQLGHKTTDARLAEAALLGFGRLTLLFQCIFEAKLSPGRALSYCGALDAVPMLEDTTDRLDSIPIEYHAMSQLLTVVGARVALRDRPEELKRTISGPEQRVLALWESNRLAPANTLINLSANVLVLQNMLWACGANASLAVHDRRESADATIIETAFSKAARCMLDLSRLSNINLPMAQQLARVWPATMLFRMSLWSGEWDADSLVTVESIETCFGPMVAAHVTGTPGAFDDRRAP